MLQCEYEYDILIPRRRQVLLFANILIIQNHSNPSNQEKFK